MSEESTTELVTITAAAAWFGHHHKHVARAIRKAKVKPRVPGHKGRGYPSLYWPPDLNPLFPSRPPIPSGPEPEGPLRDHVPPPEGQSEWREDQADEWLAAAEQVAPGRAKAAADRHVVLTSGQISYVLKHERPVSKCKDTRISGLFYSDSDPRPKEEGDG